MRIAYLILAHSNPNQLKRLIDRLSNPGVDIYIHVDLKTGIDDFLPIAHHNQVQFIKKREKVYWGSYSIIQATVNGFEQIISSGIDYNYIVLLSGQDYPIKNNTTIMEFFKANANKAFMEFYSINDVWKEAIPRLNKYYLTNYPFWGSTKLEGWINKIFPIRNLPANMIFVGRSQWVSITLQQATYIVSVLKNNHSLRRYLKFSWGCDEFAFQTILYNSPFKDDMVNDNLRYIDWSEGKVSPKTLTINDAAIIKNSTKLFARKFDAQKDIAIMNYLDKENN